NKCSGCHDVAGPEVGLALGGAISSADIVKGLVNVPSVDGGQYMRVVPGHPEQSWLYLKILGNTGSCMASPTAQCLTGPMPPDQMGKATITLDEAKVVAQWITDGALGPPN